MEATKNSRYQVSSNSSPYSLAQHHNNFVQDIARTIPFNLLMNGQFSNLNSLGLLVGWSVSGSAVIGSYNTSLQRSVTLAANSSLYQNIYNAYPTNAIQLSPNTDYTIILYSNVPASGILLEAVAPSANQIFNINDYTQTIELYDIVNSPLSGETYYKNILQFSTACTATFKGPINIHIKNISTTSQTILLGYCALYEGLVEYSYLSDKYLTNITLESGNASTPSLNYIGDLSTGIFSPEASSVAISVGGVQKITATPAGHFLIGTTTDNGIDTLQVSGSSKISGDLKITQLVSASNANFTETLTTYYANVQGNLDALDVYATNAVTGSFGIFPTSVTSPRFIGNADTATYATSAESAIYANYVLNASNAASASYATNAGSASYATNASKAASASYATNAGNANYATNASNAASASYAANAGNANYATNAGNTNYANSSGTANSASFATNSDYARTAGNANYASSAARASIADTVSSIPWSSISNPPGNAYGNRYVSSSGPSGGSDGDIWYRI